MNARRGRASSIRMTSIKFSGRADAEISEWLATGFFHRFDFKGAVERPIKRTRSACREVLVLAKIFRKWVLTVFTLTPRRSAVSFGEGLSPTYPSTVRSAGGRPEHTGNSSLGG